MIETTCSLAHFGRVSSHYWTPRSLNPLPSTLKLMARKRSPIILLCTSYTCITLSIHINGMRFIPMFNTTTIGFSIAPPTISHFRWDCDSNPWVPLMLHYLLQPHRHNIPMFIQRPTNPPDSLRGFNTSTNRSMTFCINTMLCTRTTMINTRYCTCFR
jgi:hypothetical protein